MGASWLAKTIWVLWEATGTAVLVWGCLIAPSDARASWVGALKPRMGSESLCSFLYSFRGDNYTCSYPPFAITANCGAPSNRLVWDPWKGSVHCIYEEPVSGSSHTADAFLAAGITSVLLGAATRAESRRS